MVFMKKASRTIQARLHLIAGQIEAVERMVGKKRSCTDVMHQISAIRAGLEEVASIVFAREIEKRMKRKTLTQKDLLQLTKSFSRSI